MTFPVRRFTNGGRGVRRKPGTMNKSEAEYAQQLEAMIIRGDIEMYWFEGVTLKLANDTRYTPDFMVLNSTGLIEFHEVKGYWEDDAKVKIKVAAAMFPFRFFAVRKVAKKHGGGFQITEF